MPLRGHQPLLLRSYTVLAGGLLVVAIVLDIAFRGLAPEGPRAEDAWIEATFKLVEDSIGAAGSEPLALRLKRLERDIGMPIRLIDGGDIVAPAGIGESAQYYRDDQGRSYYMRLSQDHDTVIRIGPIVGTAHSALPLLLPALFYASIFVVVALWLRPLLKDLDLLTAATRRFAADCRESLTTARETRQLTNLATNLDEMSRRTADLIQSQIEISAALSHEMRTPLARIRFGLAVVKENADETTQRELGAIGDDVQQLDVLISRLIEYARLDHPGLKMTWQQVPADTWLADVIARSANANRQVEIVPSGQSQPAYMDARLMELALSNLVSNACRYARSRVTVSFGRDAVQCRLLVEDDGPGVPVDQRENVFKAFTRLDSDCNRDVGGYGLGLAIVARVASLHGGRTTLDASPTLGGARFTIGWPCTVR